MVEHVDAVVECGELELELAEELQRLAPFGRGNPPVCLMIEEARFRDPRPMGEGRHLRFTVESRRRPRPWRVLRRGRVAAGRRGRARAATFALEVNEWNGVIEPRLVLRRAQAEPAARRRLPTAPAAPQARGGAAAAGAALSGAFGSGQHVPYPSGMAAIEDSSSRQGTQVSDAPTAGRWRSGAGTEVLQPSASLSGSERRLLS